MPAAHHQRKNRRTMNEINMVPFIDVMLVLLIIFMTTAPLISPSIVELPSVGAAAKQPDVVARIYVSKEQTLTLDYSGQQYKASFANLPAQIHQLQNKARQEKVSERPGDPIAFVIHADKQVTYEAVIRVMDTLKKAGVNRISLGVNTIS